MSTNKPFFCIALLSFVLFSQCTTHGTRAGSQTYEFIPLKDFKYEPSDIRPGTEINILGFSGEKTDSKDALYYGQFIVLDKAKGDTVRILAAAICVDPTGSSTSPAYTTPQMYDGSKAVRDAIFQIPDSDQLKIIRLQTILQDKDPDPKKITSYVEEKSVPKEYVIIQKDVPFFNRPYRTAIGVLSFKEQPW